MADIDGAVIALLLVVMLVVFAVAVAAVAVVAVVGIHAGRALVGREDGGRPSAGAVALCTAIACVAGIGAASIHELLVLSAAVVAFVLGAALGAYAPDDGPDREVRDGA